MDSLCGITFLNKFSLHEEFVFGNDHDYQLLTDLCAP